MDKHGQIWTKIDKMHLESLGPSEVKNRIEVVSRPRVHRAMC